MMKGKINPNELSNSQRQFDDHNLDIDVVRFDVEVEDPHIHITFARKLIFTLFFIFFGNCFLFINHSRLDKSLIQILCYILLSIALFFQMLFFNLILFIFILIFDGFRRFMVYHDNQNYPEKIFLISVTPLMGTFCLTLRIWKKFINNLRGSIEIIMTIFIYFSCLIMSTIIIFPQRILINIFGMIVTLIYRRNFSSFFGDLEDIYR